MPLLETLKRLGAITELRNGYAKHELFPVSIIKINSRKCGSFSMCAKLKKKTHLRKMHEKSNVVQKHFIQLTFVASNLSRPLPQAKILRLWTRGNRTYSCIYRKFSIDSLFSLPLFPKLSEFSVPYVDTTWPCKKKLKINAEIVIFI